MSHLQKHLEFVRFVQAVEEGLDGCHLTEDEYCDCDHSYIVKALERAKAFVEKNPYVIRNMKLISTTILPNGVVSCDVNIVEDDK